MATNKILPSADHVEINFSGAVAGDPVAVGSLTGVALTDSNSDDEVMIDRTGSYELTVDASDDAGSNAVSEGDEIYYDSAASPVLNKDSTNGVLFGYAGKGASISGGSSAAIEVVLK